MAKADAEEATEAEAAAANKHPALETVVKMEVMEDIKAGVEKHVENTVEHINSDKSIIREQPTTSHAAHTPATTPTPTPTSAPASEFNPKKRKRPEWTSGEADNALVEETNNQKRSARNSDEEHIRANYKAVTPALNAYPTTATNSP